MDKILLDLDSVTLCIRIRIGNPDSGYGDKKIKKIEWKIVLLSFFSSSSIFTAEIKKIWLLIFIFKNLRIEKTLDPDP
jgi:hypothetical protein